MNPSNQELRLPAAERIAQLECRNRELDAFARQLAHEMGTPLGQIAAITELLIHRDTPGPDAHRWLHVQLQVARQMQDAMQGLLDLARAPCEPLELDDIDLSALCETLRDQIPPGVRHAPVEWHIADGMHLRGCPGQVSLLMRNLLSNAVKYTRDVARPVVTVSAACGGAGVLVQDNGVGFDEACAARLFEPFVRLHGVKQFEGTGLGLSIVKRIVERHGGWIRVHAALGWGARFEFALAAA